MFIISTLYLGGLQKVTYLLADGLSKEYNVTVAYCFDSGWKYPFGDTIRLRKLPEYSETDSLPKKGLCIRRQAAVLRTLKKELAVDASVSLGNLSNLLNVLSGGTGKVICAERSNPTRSWGRWYYPVTKLLYRRSDLVIFQSETVRSLYGSRIRRKSRILKNPLVRSGPADECREKKLVTFGRLEPQKNHDLLLRSFARFHRQFPEYRLYIYGNGSLENRIRSQIGTLGLADAVILEKNDPQIHEKIRDAEMFILSSDFEGLSNALLPTRSAPRGLRRGHMRPGTGRPCRL